MGADLGISHVRTEILRKLIAAQRDLEKVKVMLYLTDSAVRSQNAMLAYVGGEWTVYSRRVFDIIYKGDSLSDAILAFITASA